MTLGIQHVPIHAAPVESATAEQRHRKLVDAAQQFEGMFLQQLLSAKGIDGEDAGSSEDSGTGGQMYKSYGTEAVSKAIAKSGGLGIARQIVRQVELSGVSVKEI